MSGHTPSAQFQAAASYLSNAASLSKVTDTVKLELYGLFKYITSSHSPSSSRPSIFSITARAKWDAWKQIEVTYGARDEAAEERYIQLARELGWSEGATPGYIRQNVTTEAKGSKDDIWDEETNTRNNPNGRGMGVRVSTMGTQEESKGATIYTFALTGYAGEIEEYLRMHPDVDLNATDSNGYTPLHLACDRGHLSVVEVLLKRGADLAIQDPDELTAIELARIAEHDDIVALLEKKGSQ